MDRLRLATVWLAGCSGCHMSFLDMDEWLLELGRFAEVVYSPLVDHKEYPNGVDVCLVEGAVGNTDNLELLCKIRRRTRTLVAFGDCAITGNVTAMRNPVGNADQVLARVYLDPSNLMACIPAERGVVPSLLNRVVPVHRVVPVEHFLPGCPPSASLIRQFLESVFTGRTTCSTGQSLSLIHI
ncbi:MAG: oxidoreductase, partial [Verrucomicrobiae bacterium]|nr:oxidoreductase [Verrucomicrobiae bacterium]